MSQNITKSSPVIKKLLLERMEELDLSAAKVVVDAHSKGRTSLTKSKMSLYLNNDEPVKGSPTEEDIIWLCFRYCISAYLNVKKMEYNEEKAMEMINKFF